MRKKRIVSTVVISLLVIISLRLLISLFLAGSLSDVLAGAEISSGENMGEMGIMFALLYGVFALVIFAIPAGIALTHGICLIFTMRNAKSPLKVVRIINYILDALNILLITGATARIMLWTLGR